MTLQVPFAQFAEAVRRHKATDGVYLAPYGDGALATARFGDATIAAHSTESVEASRASLTAQGLEAHEGQWEATLTMSGASSAPLWVVAVVYPASEGGSGVWIDAYETSPTESQALRAMYDEFVTTGQTEEIGFEPFLRIVNPRVTIVGPDQLAGYARAKVEC